MKIKLIVIGLILTIGVNFGLAKKMALLIGIGEYDLASTGWKKLSGNNDVDLLQEKFRNKGFTVSTLKDQRATKRNITSALSQLVAKANKGDMIYIHFSGHGQLVPDMNNDEPDGFDQSFICYDACFSPNYKVGGTSYKGQNHLIDDEIFPYLNQLKTKVGAKGRIIVAFDNCYSEGSARNGFDPYDNDQEEIEPADEIDFTERARGADEFDPDKYGNAYLKSIRRPDNFSRGGGELLIISACGRKQENTEIKAKHSGMGYGALSYCIGKMLDDKVPFSQWESFFNSGKYKTYRIFRNKQQPVAEKH